MVPGRKNTLVLLWRMTSLATEAEFQGQRNHPPLNSWETLYLPGHCITVTKIAMMIATAY